MGYSALAVCRLDGNLGGNDGLGVAVLGGQSLHKVLDASQGLASLRLLLGLSAEAAADADGADDVALGGGGVRSLLWSTFQNIFFLSHFLSVCFSA